MCVKKILSVIVLVVLFIGCGVSDIVKDLPNKYVYMSEAPKEKWIMNNDSKVINSKDYIPCKIESYAYDKRYIIARIKFHYDMNCPVGFKESKTLKEGRIYYYILDTTKDQRYGPFEQKKEFVKKKRELAIGLKL